MIDLSVSKGERSLLNKWPRRQTLVTVAAWTNLTIALCLSLSLSLSLSPAAFFGKACGDHLHLSRGSRELQASGAPDEKEGVLRGAGDVFAQGVSVADRCSSRTCSSPRWKVFEIHLASLLFLAKFGWAAKTERELCVIIPSVLSASPHWLGGEMLRESRHRRL